MPAVSHAAVPRHDGTDSACLMPAVECATRRGRGAGVHREPRAPELEGAAVGEIGALGQSAVGDVEQPSI
jgi:hypothetical protein